MPALLAKPKSMMVTSMPHEVFLAQMLLRLMSLCIICFSWIAIKAVVTLERMQSQSLSRSPAFSRCQAYRVGPAKRVTISALSRHTPTRRCTPGTSLRESRASASLIAHRYDL